MENKVDVLLQMCAQAVSQWERKGSEDKEEALGKLGPAMPCFFKGSMGTAAAVTPGSGEVRREARGPLTLKISNVPFCYNQADLFKEMGLHGFSDFFHLHASMYLGHHVGVAVANFPSQEDALCFASAWQGRKLKAHGNQKKALKVSKAPEQGRFANLRAVQLDTPILPIVNFEGNYVCPWRVVRMISLAKEGFEVMGA